jgi:hypothetical protein
MQAGPVQALPADSAVAPTAHSGLDEHSVCPLSSMKMHDNRHSSDGQLTSIPLSSRQAGQDPQRPERVVTASDPTGDATGTETLFPAYAEAVLPAAAALLTDILPMDFSALESSICAFFEQIESFGSNLGEKSFDLWTSAGILLAAAVALEVARRQIKPATPSFTPGRQSIPYSDCV